MQTDKPNIVFILIDDMGWRDLACSGSTFYETPNIDELRHQGMLFDNAYASCPVCSPSRASVMTGKYPARLGVTDWIDNMGNWHPCRGPLIDAPYIKHLPKGEKTVAHYLKEQGYSTWHVGKWHLGLEEYYPEKVGFDRNIGGCDMGSPSHGYFSPYHIKTLPEKEEGEYLTDRITDEAIALIHSADASPFFLNLWHYTVHIPTQAKKEDIEYFESKAKRLSLDTQSAIINCEPFQTEHNKNSCVQRRILQSDTVYAAMVYNLDYNVGRLVDALKEKGVYDNTLIVFTSDNGGLSTAEGSPTCNLPAREGKGWTNEGGLRVPMFAVWNGKIKPDVLSHQVVTTPDIFCTFLEAAGTKPQDDTVVDGVSLIPAFHGEALEDRPVFWHYPHYGNQGGTPGAAVRMGAYKLIEFFDDDHTELYDVEADISEQKDLTKEMPEKSKELLAVLKQWQKAVTALFPQENEDYRKSAESR